MHLFTKWISTSVTIQTLTETKGCDVSPHTLLRHFDQFLDSVPPFVPQKTAQSIYLKADGKYFGKWGCILVFKEGKNIIYWDFVQRENYANYRHAFHEIRKLNYEIQGLTSDWHGSITASFFDIFPDFPHQRCLVHTQRFCQTYLTQNPETEAGKELLEISRCLPENHSKNDRDIWLKWFLRWEQKYISFLKERTYQEHSKKWWYTHQNVRRVYRSLKLTFDHLFLYLDYQKVEKDTNGLEAEFNHLKQKLAVHKGLTRKRKVNFIRWYFYLKSPYFFN